MTSSHLPSFQVAALLALAAAALSSTDVSPLGASSRSSPSRKGSTQSSSACEERAAPKWTQRESAIELLSGARAEAKALQLVQYLKNGTSGCRFLWISHMFSA